MYLTKLKDHYFLSVIQQFSQYENSFDEVTGQYSLMTIGINRHDKFLNTVLKPGWTIKNLEVTLGTAHAYRNIQCCYANSNKGGYISWMA
jgi:hypothetical protein